MDATQPSIPWHEPWQRTRRAQVLAILLGILPVYGMTILSHLQRDRPYGLNDILFYTGVIASLMLVVLLLLLRFLCGETFGDLNLRRAHWWQDLLGGVALAALTLAALNFLGPPLRRILPGAPDSGLGDVMNGLVRSPWLLALFVGPILAVGAAGFEEIARVFLLSRWWKIAPGTIGRWSGVLVSSALFGLAHLYQGPAGMANTAMSGLILAIVYLRFGRVWPLIISHYLHDALQILLYVYLIRSGAI